MNQSKNVLQEFRNEFLKFMTTMEELRLLRHVSKDLKKFRKMIKFKKYD